MPWIFANGVLLPMAAAFIYALLYRKDSQNALYRIFSFLAVLVPTASMLAWVMIPVFFLQGNAPAKDDVTHFLNIFSQEYPPLAVSAVSAAIIGISVTLMIKKRIVHNYIEEVRQLKQR